MEIFYGLETNRDSRIIVAVVWWKSARQAISEPGFESRSPQNDKNRWIKLTETWRKSGGVDSPASESFKSLWSSEAAALERIDNEPALNAKKWCHSPGWIAEWVMTSRKSYFSTRYLAIKGVMTDWPRLWARNWDILRNFLAPRHFLDLQLSLLAIFPTNHFPDYSFLKTVGPGNCTFFSIVSVPFTHSPEAVFYFNIHRPSLLEPDLNI